MKTLIFTLSILLCTNLALAANYPTKQIIQYTLAQKQTIELPTHFAKPFIIDQKDIDLLAGKTIHHVELIYTKYAESPSFNQTALNTERISQLKKLLPQVNSDGPSWTWLEQTGATTRDAANEYFHGFVIHYGNKLNHTELGEFFSSIAGKANTFNVTIAEGGTFSTSSGTKIHVPANAVTDKNGRAVTGEFKLNYTEYRNSAEIALSGLPMTYKGENFSSIGMYDLRGEKEGEELKLKKPITVDFNCTKVVDDAAFYSMDDRTGKWKKEKELTFEVKNTPILKQNRIDAGSTMNSINPPSQLRWTKVDDKTMKALLDTAQWNRYKQLDQSTQSLGVISENLTKRSVVVRTDKWIAFQQKISDQPIYTVERDEFWGTDIVTIQPKGGKGQVTTTRTSRPGHSFPTIVRGLQSSRFGVYNCDQVYRLGQVARLNPVYRDAESNEKIDNGFVACVIDLTKNGSFSFHPNNLVVNKKGRTTVLLFTKEKEIYLIDEKAFAQLNLNTAQNIQIPMKRVTEQLNSPSDLKKMLNI